MRPRFVSALLLVAMAAALFRTTASAAPRVEAQRRVLPNGAVLLVSEQRNLPIVIVQLLLDAGARRDPAGKAGLADLTADLLTEGTAQRSAAQISETTDFLGARLGAGADTDYALVTLSVLADHLEEGLNLLADILLQPSFPEAEVGRRREATLAGLKASEDNPGYVAQREFVRTVFPDQPYGHLVSGTPASVSRLTRDDVLAFYRTHYRPERAIMAVVGDVAAADIEARLNAALREWKPGGAGPFVYPDAPPVPPAVETIHKPISQANIILGQRGIARDNPDYYAVTVMNFILGGGGFTSRLLDDIRTKAGLAYSVSSGFSVNKAPGSFQVTMQTKTASTADAIRRACATIEGMRAAPVTDEELSGARQYLTGSFPLRLDSNSKLAGFLVQTEYYNLGLDYAETYAQRIDAVTRDDVLRVARQYLHPEEMILVVVGDLPAGSVPPAPACGGGSRTAAHRALPHENR
ncbi:insulinase family protein [Candidatus Binatia bacterium]|nr:insulinase family protein [Candidatus Binatia bacterium]